MFEMGNQLRSCTGQEAMQNVNVQPTLMERLKGRQAQTQSQLAEIDGLIESLEKNPEMEKMLTALSRLF